MTDLQMSLIGLAGVFVAGVFTYNKIQEYKAKKSVERAFGTDHDDVLMRDPNAPNASSAPSYAQNPVPAAPVAPAPVRAAAPVTAPGLDPAVRQEPSFSLDEPVSDSPGVAGAEATASAAALGAVLSPVSPAGPALPPIPEFTIDPVAPGAPEPDEDPPVVRARSHGLTIGPHVVFSSCP